MADGEARPQGADQLPFGAPPAVGRRALPRLRRADRPAAAPGRRRRLAGARRGREPGGPAAALGGLAARGRLGGGRGARGPHRRLQLRLRRRRAPVPRAQRRAAARRPPHALDPLPDRRPHAPRRRGHDLLAPARDLLDHGDADRRAAARHARGAGRGRAARALRRHARPGPPAPPQPGAQARAWARRSRSRTRSPATGRRWELREDFVSSTEFDRHFCLDQVSGDVELGPAIRETDGGWTQYGAVPPEGRGAALHALPPRRRPPRQHHRRRARRAAGHDPRRRQRHEPEAGRRRRRRRGARARPPARVDGDPHALPRGHRRGLRVPRGRGLPARRARGLRPAAATARPCRCTSSRTSSRPTASSPTSSSRPTRTCSTEVAEYLDERRLIGTTVQLLPCKFRGLSVVVNLQASPLADTARVEEDVAHALYTYLNPLVGGNVDRAGRGLAVRPRAQPGRALRRRPRGRRRRVREDPADLRDRPAARASSRPSRPGTHIVLEPDELIASGAHIVKASHREA